MGALLKFGESFTFVRNDRYRVVVLISIRLLFSIWLKFRFVRKIGKNPKIIITEI